MLSAALLIALAAVVLRLGSFLPHSALNGDAAAPAFARATPSRNQGLRIAGAELPVVFEPNQGQTDPQVKFLARGPGYGLFLTANQAVLALRGIASHSRPSAQRESVLQCNW